MDEIQEIILTCTEEELNCLIEIMEGYLAYEYREKSNPYGIKKFNVILNSEKQLSDILYYMTEKKIVNNDLRQKIQSIGHHMFNW
jgi:hypothetical protein